MSEMKVYDWDDDITEDAENSIETVLLPAGNYPFEVVRVDKEFYPGGPKVPACNVAKVYLRIDGGELGSGFCVENLYLYEKAQWKAAQFLCSLGLKKHGESVKWRLLDQCEGETGRCRIALDQFEQNGEKKENNKVVKFFDKEEKPAPKKAFEKGKF